MSAHLGPWVELVAWNSWAIISSRPDPEAYSAIAAVTADDTPAALVQLLFSVALDCSSHTVKPAPNRMSITVPTASVEAVFERLFTRTAGSSCCADDGWKGGCRQGNVKWPRNSRCTAPERSAFHPHVQFGRSARGQIGEVQFQTPARDVAMGPARARWRGPFKPCQISSCSESSSASSTSIPR